MNNKTPLTAQRRSGLSILKSLAAGLEELKVFSRYFVQWLERIPNENHNVEDFQVLFLLNDVLID